MTIYFIFYIIPVIMFLARPKANISKYSAYFVIVSIAVLMIGYRSYTGGDWGNYLLMFNKIGGNGFYDAIIGASRHSNAVLFNLLFWLGYNYADFYITNTIFSIFSFYALYRFAKVQPYFWLTISVSVPFFVLIMIMGYTRQGLALSVLMIAITYLSNNRLLYYMIGVVIASGLHNSAIVFTLLAIPNMFKMSKYRTITLMVAFPIVLLGATSFEGYFATKIDHYVLQNQVGSVGGQISSVGALIRILINAGAAVAFYIYRKQWKRVFPDDYGTWQLLSIAALSCVPLMFLASTTSADRIALYLLMVQLAVWPRIVYLSKPETRKALCFCIVAAYGGILVLWLNFSINSVLFWLPFRHHLFGTL